MILAFHYSRYTFYNTKGSWPSPWPRMTLKVISLRMTCRPLTIPYTGLLHCYIPYIESDCGRREGRTYGRTYVRMDEPFYTNSMSHLCWWVEMTKNPLRARADVYYHPHSFRYISKFVHRTRTVGCKTIWWFREAQPNSVPWMEILKPVYEWLTDVRTNV